MWNDRKRILGVIHLLPLPGSPRFGGKRTEIRGHALRDARAYIEGGCHGLILENFGDSPFRKDRVEPAVVAEMTALALEIRAELPEDRLLGINVLRNDATSALSIAAATQADFIRVNVHTGTMFTDQGTIEGRADETLRLRSNLVCQVDILADVAVKHATPPPGFDLTGATQDLALRGGADGIIVTGSATGSGTALDDLESVRSAVPEGYPVLAGSGVQLENLKATLQFADAVIVGTSLKHNGDVAQPVDRERVRAMVSRADS